VRGGSYYQPQGSIWYFPQVYKINEHGKLLMTSPSMDRSGALGFRCVQTCSKRHLTAGLGRRAVKLSRW
jgi:hypothetical protein